MAEGGRKTGGAANGRPKDKLDNRFLLRLARYTLTSDEQSQLGLFLEMDRSTVRDIIRNSTEGVVTCTFDILDAWRRGTNIQNATTMYEQLCGAYMDIKKPDIAECVRSEQVRHLSEQLKKSREENQSCRQRSNEQMRVMKEEMRLVKDELRTVKEELRRVTKELGTSNGSADNIGFHPNQRLLVMGGLTDKEGKKVDHNLVHYWAEDKKCWKELVRMPQSVGRLYNVCQLSCDKLLMTVGEVGGVRTADCWLLDLVDTTWTQMPPLSIARIFHHSFVLHQYVYVLGGKDASKKTTASVERFDVVQRRWSSLPNLPQAVYAPSVISNNHRIYVFGGFDTDDKTLACSHVYDRASGQWLPLPDMPEACPLGAAVSLGRFIYLVGGGWQSCLRFDPATDQWTQLSRPRLRHANAPAVVWEGGILVGGDGGGDEVGSAVIEHYDPVTDQWTDWQTPLKEPLASHTMFSVTLSGV